MRAMYHHLEGVLDGLGPTRAIIDAGGVGYELRIPLSTFEALKGRHAERVRLLTHLQVLEDGLRLFGFATEEEREMFRLTTSISGVGPAIALAALSTFTVEVLAEAIRLGDSRSLQRIKGVGQKLSQRLVLELKDRVTEISARSGSGGHAGKPGLSPHRSRGSPPADAVAALVELGFSRKEAEDKVDAAVARLQAGSAGAGNDRAHPAVEVILQAALRTRG